MEQASLFNIFVCGFKVLRKPWQLDVLWFPVCGSPLFVIICYSNPLYQKTQGKDTAQAFPSSSKQAAAVRMSDWEETVWQRAFKEGKSDVVAYTLHCLELYWLLSLSKPTYFKTATAAKTDRTLACLSPVIKQLSIFPFKTATRNKILWLSGQMQYLWLSLSFIYQKHVAWHFKRTENGNLSNKLLSSLAFSAQQLFSPEVNLLQSSICKVIICPLVNIPLRFNLVIIR